METPPRTPKYIASVSRIRGKTYSFFHDNLLYRLLPSKDKTLASCMSPENMFTP